MLLTASELRLLLEGCGISDLLVPEVLGRGLSSCDEVAPALMGLARDGLMPMEADGRLGYADGLREALALLGKSRVCLVAFVAGEAGRPVFLHLSPDLRAAVALQQDVLRRNAVSVAVKPLEDVADELVGDAREVPLVAGGYGTDMMAWPWETLAGEGVMLGAAAFARGERVPLAQLLALRTEAGDLAAVRDAGGTEAVSLGGGSLVALARKVKVS